MSNNTKNPAAEVPITIAYGDGIGPEIMNATLDIILAAGAKLKLETIEIGEKVYNRGNSAGIEPGAWDLLRRTKVFLKAPVTTPQGGGFKSLNVSTRKTLGLFANVRPCVSYSPFVQTKHPVMDVVVIRENEEDLYAGIEYRHTDQVTEGLKLISSPGSEKIIRYAFEYARANHRKKVTCFMKDNIMKITDGLFHRTFDAIGGEFSDIEKETWIVDIGAAKLATSPENFDVVVMENLYGDILSDVTAQMTGSVGLAGSANIGDTCAMFEAIHGSAPRRAGKNLANPSGLMLGAVMMLVHIGQVEVAARVHNAWLRTIEDGMHTYDIYREGNSKQKLGTKEFAQAVIARLGQMPNTLKAVQYRPFEHDSKSYKFRNAVPAKKDLVGVDIYLDWVGKPDDLASKLGKCAPEGIKLTVISNRGVSVWPGGQPETFLSDHWRCRFEAEKGTITHEQIIAMLNNILAAGLNFIKTENLINFDGASGFSSAKG